MEKGICNGQLNKIVHISDRALILDRYIVRAMHNSNAVETTLEGPDSQIGQLIVLLQQCIAQFKAQ